MADTPATTSLTITSKANETMLSQDGKTVYVAGTDGKLSAYDLASGALQSSWAVGKQLGGMALTADNHYAVVTERTPTASYVDQYGNKTYTVAVYRVDLTSGAVKAYSFNPTSLDYTFYDAAVLSNGKVLLTQSFQGSGWITLRTLDLDTGIFAALPGSYRQDSTLSSSLAGSKILLAESNISSAPLDILTVGTSGVSQTATNGSSGFNRGTQAISADGHVIADFVYGTGLLVFDGNLKFTYNLVNKFPDWNYSVAGLALNADGSTLYVADAGKYQIVALSTTDWSVKATYDASAALKGSNAPGHYGDDLLVTGDGGYLVVTGPGGVTRIDTGIINGTAGADTLTGTAGPDKLYGLDGNDVLNGGAGNDQLYGGSGNDVLNGGSGDDLIDGGPGLDRADYLHAFQTYAATRTAGGSIVLHGGTDEGTDTLTSVETITFKDGTLISDPDAVGSQIIRLYDAAFGRVPDAAGLDFWRTQIEQKSATLGTVAASLMASAEFQAATGNLSNGDFVDYLYQHALGRAADAGGKAFWTSQLAGGMSRGDLLASFSESAEHRASTAVTVAQGYFVTDPSYKAVALMYDSALGRIPDQAGLSFWADQVKTGTLTVGQVADDFAASAEFAGKTSQMSHAQLVDFMYINTLHRAADAGGRAYWVDQLDHGLSAGALLNAFSQSAEHAGLFASHLLNGIDIAG